MPSSSERFPLGEPANSLSELVETAKEKGSADISEISPGDQQRLLEWYRTEFERLSGEDQADFLEEFIQHQVVDDDSAAAWIQALPEREQRAQVGTHLGLNTATEKYLHSFYACWDDIPHDSRQKITTRFTVDQPQDAIVIAPFINLDRRPAPVETWENPNKQESILKVYYQDFDHAKRLIEELLTYSDAYFSPHTARDVIEHYFKNDRILLYPYVEQLEKHRLLGPEQIQSFYNPESIPYIRPHLTPSEKKQAARVMQKMAQLYPGQTPQDLLTSDTFPRKLAVEASRLRDQGIDRVTRHFLEGFERVKPRLQEKDEFLAKALENGYPLFVAPEKLGLNKQGIRRLAQKNIDRDGYLPFYLEGFEDLHQLLRFDKENPSEKPALENWLVSEIRAGIQEHTDNLISNRGLALHANTVLGWFEEGNRRKLIEAINQSAPSLWLYNLRFAIAQKVMPFETLLEETARDPYTYLHRYEQLVYHERREMGTSQATQVREQSRKIFVEAPWMMFDEPFQRIVQECLTPEEQRRIIEKSLRVPVDQYFFSSLIHSPVAADYRELSRKALMLDGQLFGQMTTYPETWEDLQSILGKHSFVEQLIIHVKEVNFDAMPLDESFMQELSSSNKIDALFQAMSKEGRGQALTAFIGRWKSAPEISQLATKELSRLCQEQKNFIFEKGVAEALPLDEARQYVDRDIEEYVELYPEVLIQ